MQKDAAAHSRVLLWKREGRERVSPCVQKVHVHTAHSTLFRGRNPRAFSSVPLECALQSAQKERHLHRSRSLWFRWHHLSDDAVGEAARSLRFNRDPYDVARQPPGRHRQWLWPGAKRVGGSDRQRPRLCQGQSAADLQPAKLHAGILGGSGFCFVVRAGGSSQWPTAAGIH